MGKDRRIMLMITKIPTTIKPIFATFLVFS